MKPRPKQSSHCSCAKSHAVAALCMLLAACAHAPNPHKFTADSSFGRPPKIKRDVPMETNNLIVFDHAAKIIDAFYFDSTFGGIDWPTIRARYRELAAAATDDATLYATLGKMLGEFPSSHLEVHAPEKVRAEKKFAGNSVSLTGMVTLMLPDTSHAIVYDLVPGGPADRAGIKRGWIQFSEPRRANKTIPPHDGEITRWRFLDAENQIHDIDLTMRLGKALPPAYIERVRGDGLVYVRFDAFNRKNTRLLRDSLRRHRDAPGFIIDVRFNSGGESIELAKVVGEFFETPIEIGRTIDRKTGDMTVFSHKNASPACAHNKPVGILISNNSASGAEIFASILQQTKRATVFGFPECNSMGAVLMSADFPLPGEGRLRIPVRDFLMPDGTRLEGKGVQADITERLPTVQDIRANHDPLEERAAVEILKRSTYRPGNN